MAQSQQPKPNVQTIDRSPPADIEHKMQPVGGSKNDNFNYSLLRQVIGCSWLPESSSAEERKKEIQTVIAAMIGIRPGDEIEGMFAAQMVATHNATMECFRRAMLEDQTFEGRRENLNQANKMTRS